MNQSLLLHVVERLESLVGKLPATIQKPILSELTPLKELFLQQRPPRFVFTGSDKMTMPEIVERVFGITAVQPFEIYHWKDLDLPDRGTMSILDVRGADAANSGQIEEELKRQPADVIFFVDDCEGARGPRKIDISNLRDCLRVAAKTKIIALAFPSPKRKATTDCAERIRTALEADGVVDVLSFNPDETSANTTKQLMSILAREVPNEARIEMIRFSRDKDAQHQIAQVLVKSTAAICTAIGAQPIPLADMPILTTLQLVMVSAIMYVSGRERSLRAATEFVGALGANLGAGMLLREGARAILKFFPGWGNVVSGMVAGAGTYAMGRAATVFFIDGLSLKDARRTYLKSRKKVSRAELLPPKATKRRRSAANDGFPGKGGRRPE